MNTDAIAKLLVQTGFVLVVSDQEPALIEKRRTLRLVSTPSQVSESEYGDADSRRVINEKKQAPTLVLHSHS
jgi:hypothetical protein